MDGPKKGQYFFYYSTLGRLQERQPAIHDGVVRPVRMQPPRKTHPKALLPPPWRVESYKYLPLAARPSFTLSPLALAGVGTNPEEPGIWDMHLPPLSSFRGTDGAAIQCRVDRGTKFGCFYLIVRFFLREYSGFFAGFFACKVDHPHCTLVVGLNSSPQSLQFRASRPDPKSLTLDNDLTVGIRAAVPASGH